MTVTPRDRLPRPEDYDTRHLSSQPETASEQAAREARENKRFARELIEALAPLWAQYRRGMLPQDALSPRDRDMLLWVQTRPEMQDYLKRRLQQQSGNTTVMTEDGQQGTRNELKARRDADSFLIGINNATAGLAGAVMQKIGQWAFPDNPSRANAMGSLGASIGEVASAGAETIITQHRVQEDLKERLKERLQEDRPLGEEKHPTTPGVPPGGGPPHELDIEAPPPENAGESELAREGSGIPPRDPALVGHDGGWAQAETIAPAHVLEQHEPSKQLQQGRQQQDQWQQTQQRLQDWQLQQRTRDQWQLQQRQLEEWMHQQDQMRQARERDERAQLDRMRQEQMQHLQDQMRQDQMRQDQLRREQSARDQERRTREQQDRERQQQQAQLERQREQRERLDRMRREQERLARASRAALPKPATIAIPAFRASGPAIARSRPDLLFRPSDGPVHTIFAGRTAGGFAQTTWHSFSDEGAFIQRSRPGPTILHPGR